MTSARRLAGLERRPLPGGLTLLVAGDRRSRRRGLARLDALPTGHALLLERCRSVHTLGMRFALDLLWLDRDGALLPWTAASARAGSARARARRGDDQPRRAARPGGAA